MIGMILLAMVLVEKCWTQDCSCERGSLWLVNGYSELEGRLELYQGGSRFTVCTPISEGTAGKICKRLGFSSKGARVLPYDRFGRSGNTDELSYKITCSSDTCCLCDNKTVRCEQAAIQCQPKQCEEWEVRLAGGESRLLVREVCINEKWLPFHHSSSGLHVICRQLGLSIYGVNRIAERLNKNTSQAVEIECSGNEGHLSHCTDWSIVEAGEVSSIVCRQKCHLCDGRSPLDSVEAISGLATGCLAFVMLVIGYLSLQLAVAVYYKKRLVMKSKERKRKDICASLHNIFSQPDESCGDGATPTAGTTPLDKAKQTLREAEIVTSQCVAYTAVPPSQTPKQGGPEMYEDVVPN